MENTQEIMTDYDVALAAEAGDEPETLPTPAEAKAMFDARPDLASVQTTAGRMHRSGAID